MPNFADLPKAYEASQVEDEIYRAWEESGVFNPDKLPDRNQKGEPYCIVMPPPNRTGTLHMGHATMLAIEDLMIRFERMRGKKTLWIPGTDHAAIATQVKVEQVLIKQGMKDPRRELGREKFLEQVVAFAEESATTIRNQVRKMGSSCDWSREKYTLDQERNHAVNEMFKRMYEDGVIERGYRLVNWDPQFQTTLSDDEVLTKEIKTKLYTFTYDKDFPITISTTRPETKFGDTAVAVHPLDERYKAYIGKTYKPVFCGKQLTIQIVGDEAVDPNFGTGALGVTPAHSMIDEEIAERHALPMEQVIGPDGRLMDIAGSAFAGLTILEAREKIEAQLKQEGVLQTVEEIEQNLPVAERGGAPVEQLPMKQWFIRVNKKFALRQDTLGKWKKGELVTLKELMIETIQSKKTNIIPERFEKVYFHWINHLRDWCISRQIWFGHRIPVWYKGGELTISETSPGQEWQQDSDTLDTWFSSGLWTFSTLGWPEETPDLKTFHPTAVLETGYDILFFWVARMILMSTYALGEVPFKDVYLHGLVRDEQGRKMSKSLGNILDPLDLIPKYGTDAVRLSLLVGTSPGQDMKLSEEKIEGFRNFTNKLWNISRFILMQIGDSATEGALAVQRDKKDTLADQWISIRLHQVALSVTKKLETYQFSSAGEELRDFTWGDLADWYLEIAKVEGEKAEMLTHILQTLLKLWHPFMPFVTEYIWQTAGFEGRLIVAEWPIVKQQQVIPSSFEGLRSFVTDVRRLRSEQKVEPIKKIDLSVICTAEMRELLTKNEAWIKRLMNASQMSFVTSIPQDWVTFSSGSWTLGIDLSSMMDVASERLKIQKELDELSAYVESTEMKLTNQEFLSKAPEKVVMGMKDKLIEAINKRVALQERLGMLSR